MKKTTLVFAAVALMVSSYTFAGGQYGKSGVFVSSATNAGAFTSKGTSEVGFVGVGGGQAHSPTGKVAVNSATEQYGAAQGGQSDILTSVNTGAIALQNKGSSSASAGSETVTTSSVKNGTAVTSAGATVNAVANNWHSHFHH
ncbi:MAG: hypothetical protein KBC78_00190 [Candidatus Pacebacteria bacterium]|nr:hypothetical protein [Candidatus Paceibacterota bacterium]